MKRVKQRAFSAYIFAGLLILGLAVYMARYFSDGNLWAVSRINRGAYSDGILKGGLLADRDGEFLASSSGGVYRYADDYAVRVSSLHVVGDYGGNIGTGALRAFSPELLGYSPIGGTYSRDGLSNPVKLTIDAELQVAARNALAGRRGAVLVMDYTNGEIICMVSSPSFDPVSPPNLALPEYEGAYINRTISSKFTPGSVFKLVTLAAAIENIGGLNSKKFTCTGSTVVDGREVKCSGVHGEQTIELAFANSCNPAFAQISVELGADVLERYTRALGLLDGHGIDGIPTTYGEITPGKDGSSELAWSGIGQSKNLISPYAMLRLSAAIANGGVLPDGHLLLKKSGSGGNVRLLKAETAKAIADMMSYNVAYSYGKWNFPNLDIHAKTGTAEVGDKPPHAWFVGFLNDAVHPYAFTVMVENGGGGLSAAGPVANAVLQAAVKDD